MSAVDSEYFDLHETGGATVVRMDVSSIRHPPQAQEFSRDLADLVETYKRTHIVVNLKGVEYFGSSAFAALFALYKKLDAAGGKMVLCDLEPDLESGVRVVGLGTFAPIFDSEAEAVAAVTS